MQDYLAFRDITQLIGKYTNGKLTLDFGCETGRSSRFLQSLGLTVDAVDISQEMINKAGHIDQTIPYMLILANKIPQSSNFYDLVFSSLVLFEVSCLDKLLKTFREIHRVLKNGIFIIVTGSIEMYKH